MATKYKNIVGSGFPDYVKEQLQARQDLVRNAIRNSSALQFLTNRNSFVRLSSGVLTKNDQNKFTSDLAKTNVLQGGTVTINNNTATFNKRYSVGPTDNLGFKPNPGITSLSVGTGGRWQTLMQADIEFTCYDLDQLDTMSKLYMSLGCHVFLEWGHIPYIDNSGTLQKNITTLNFFNFNKQDQIIQEINRLRKVSKGNYDAILGRVYNFDFNANPDGTYNCKIQVMGPGQMIESLRINSFNNFDYSQNDSDTIESSKFESSLTNALTNIKKYLIDSNIAKVEVLNQSKNQENGGSYVTNNAAEQTGIDSLKTTLGVINSDNFFENLVEDQSYGKLLNSIYSKALYKGPNFVQKDQSNELSAINFPNDFVKYGNAHQVVSKVGEKALDELNPISPSLYNGYVTAQPSQLSNNQEETSFSTYITLGHLFTLIQHIAIPVESPSKPDTTTTENNVGFNPNFQSNNSNNFTPIVKIDYHPDNTIINRGPLEASINPNTCLIPLSIAERIYKNKSYNGQDAFSIYFSPLNTTTTSVPNWLGNLTTLGNAEKNLFTKKGLNKVNNVLGDTSFEGKIFNILINIDFVIDSLSSLSSTKDSSVSLQSLVENLLDGINNSLGQVNNFRVFFDDNSQCIRIIDETVTEKIEENKILEIPNYGTESTTYDYSFQSKISPKLASQIVISTQAESSGGLQEFSEDVLTYKKLNEGVEDKFSQSIKQPLNSRYTPEDDKGTSVKSLQSLFDHLYLCYGGNTRQILNPSSISSLTNVYKELQNTQKKFLKTTYGNVLIPLEYSITIDGISGVLPYNIFKVPNNRLPKKYRNNVAFSVFSINHNFENNQWTTTLRGQTILTEKASINETQEIPVNFIGPLPQNQT